MASGFRASPRVSSYRRGSRPTARPGRAPRPGWARARPSPRPAGPLPPVQAVRTKLRASLDASRWLSAKRAVDADLVQTAFQGGELLVIEFCDEQLGDAAHMNRSGLAEAGHADVGERDQDSTPVGVGGASTNEALVNQAGDTAGHARA